MRLDCIGIALNNLLYVLLLGPGTTTTQGTASHNLPLPNDPALIGFTAYAQWAVGSITNPGFALSTVARYQVLP